MKSSGPTVGVGVAMGSGVGVGVGVAVGVGDGGTVAVGVAVMACALLPGSVCVVAFPPISKISPMVRKTPQPKPKAMPVRNVFHCRCRGGAGCLRAGRLGVMVSLTSRNP